MKTGCPLFPREKARRVRKKWDNEVDGEERPATKAALSEMYHMASIHTLCQQALTYTQAQEDLLSSSCVCQCWLTAYFSSFMFTCTVLLQCDQLKHVREAMSEQRAGKEALPPTPPYFHFQSDLLNLQVWGVHRKSALTVCFFLTPHLSIYAIVSNILCWNFGVWFYFTVFISLWSII